MQVSHGDDHVVLVPHVEGIWVRVGEGRGYVQRADSFHPTFFRHVLIEGAKQAVCGWVKREGIRPKQLSSEIFIQIPTMFKKRSLSVLFHLRLVAADNKPIYIKFGS